METMNKNNEKEVELKHLGFVRTAAIQALVCVSSLYNYAKENSGPLKSTVGTVEGAVSAVVTPVCDKFKDVPDSLLVFVDNKVDVASQKLDKLSPPVAKQVVSQATIMIHKATEKAQNIVKEAQTGGPKAAFNYAATEYKAFVVTNSVKAWVKLNQYKPIHTVADKTLPMAALLSEKYNCMVKDMAQKGYPGLSYLPMVPVDEIVKAFRTEDAHEAETRASDSESD